MRIVIADDEPLGDLGVGQAPAHQAEHLALALGEQVERLLAHLGVF